MSTGGAAHRARAVKRRANRLGLRKGLLGREALRAALLPHPAVHASADKQERSVGHECRRHLPAGSLVHVQHDTGTAAARHVRQDAERACGEHDSTRSAHAGLLQPSRCLSGHLHSKRRGDVTCSL